MILSPEPPAIVVPMPDDRARGDGAAGRVWHSAQLQPEPMAGQQVQVGVEHGLP